jgi:hypothetical protein
MTRRKQSRVEANHTKNATEESTPKQTAMSFLPVATPEDYVLANNGSSVEDSTRVSPVPAD